jgi:hypothetical protein
MTIKTFKGKLDMGSQEQIRLSTNDGLTGYRINKFQLISSTPGTTGSVEYVGQIFLTDQTNNITNVVDFNDADFLAVAFYQDRANASSNTETIILDKETFNQDIFINITDAEGGTIPCNYYIELEQMKLDLNASTYITIKNIRSRTQV